jgi:DNA-binding FadR family transcriptional regulator
MNELMYYNLKETSGLTYSLATQVAREIGRQIVAQNYKTDDLLEDEDSLAKRYQVSRSVIRDAVKILVGKGLLEVRRGIGTRVRARHNWGLLDDDVLAWHQAAPPSPEFVRQLLDMRLIIEPKAARWAAERGSDEKLQKIKEAQEKMDRSTGTEEDFVLADAHFHRAILRAANNEILEAMEGVIFLGLLGSIRLTNNDPDSNAASLPFHQEVTNAILARDPDKAEDLMEKLLADTKRGLEEFILGS